MTRIWSTRHIRLHAAGTGQEINSDSERSTPSSIGPAGTASAAHHLLNPKRRPRSMKTSAKSSPMPGSSRSSSVNSMDSSVQSVAKPDLDMDVEFVDTQLQNGGVSKRDAKNFDGNHNGASHRSLIEDMYGVERRENQPYKKMKVNHGEEKVNPRSVNYGPGDSGLGEWMKKEQATSASPSVVTPNIVDLTTGMRLCMFEV